MVYGIECMVYGLWATKYTVIPDCYYCCSIIEATVCIMDGATLMVDMGLYNS